GCIGLIKSVDNFDITQNVRFSTYAVPMIIGEIRRYLRDNSSIRVSRSIKDTAYKAMQVKERLMAKNQTEPTVSEIANELGIPCEDVVIALESIVSPVSIYDPIYSDGGDTIFVLDQLGDNNDDNNWLDEISLKESIKNLSEREKTILSLRFMQGKTQMEVSEEIGISQAQVSRLEKGAIDKIKN
ncbi:MAG: sigma-70 family RNA polymerase sigma factor, partial [Clostridia bacterium]|nr:sigma-70 family RNA polymerase sigma factor [Clostridia bacterium]